MQIATGKFIAFVDGDDFVENTMFEQLYNTATEQTADTVFCGFYFYKENTPIISHHEVDSVSIFDNEDIKNKILLNMIGTEPHVKSDRLFSCLCGTQFILYQL